jgi:hypothetical protein
VITEPLCRDGIALQCSSFWSRTDAAQREGAGGSVLGGKTGEEVRYIADDQTNCGDDVLAGPSSGRRFWNVATGKLRGVRSMVSRLGFFSSHPCRALREWGLVSGDASGHGSSTKAAGKRATVASPFVAIRFETLDAHIRALR